VGKAGGFILSAVQIVAGAVLLFVPGGAPIGVPMIVSGVATLVGTLLAPRPLGGDGYKSSPTYGSAGFANAAFEGSPKRIVLGKVRTPPAFVSAISEKRGSKMYLKAAMYVCDGGPYGIQAIDDIMLQDQTIEHYKKITVTKLLGTATQKAPKGYEKVSIPYATEGHLAKNDTYLWTTKAKVDEIAILLVWRSGLYYASGRDGIEAKSAKIKVEIRVENDDGSSGDWTAVYPEKKQMGDGWERSGNGEWKAREKRQAAYHQVMRITLHGTDKDVDLKLTDAARVTVRLTGRYNNGGNSRCEPDVQQIEEIVSDARDYAGAAMLYIEALAQEQLSSGTLFKVSALVSGWKCKDVRDDSIAWTRNPALHLREVLIEESVGAGKWISESDIDLDYVEDAADVCDENAASSGEHKEARFQCDLVIDTIAPVTDWMEQILLTMRGAVVEWGGKLRLVQDIAQTYDRHFDARSAKAVGTRPVTLDEAEKPIIGLQYIDHDRRPNIVTVAYRDRDDEYAQDWTDELGEDDLGTDEQQVRVEIPIFAVTRATQAVRECRYWLNRFRLRPQLLSLGIHRGDFDLVPMDVIRVSADYPTLAAVEFQVISTHYGPGGRGILNAMICHADAYTDTTDKAAAKALSLTRAEALKAARKQPWPAKGLKASVVHR
jgi:hypothetical protein